MWVFLLVQTSSLKQVMDTYVQVNSIKLTGSRSKLHYIQYLRYNRVKKNFLKTGCER